MFGRHGHDVTDDPYASRSELPSSEPSATSFPKDDVFSHRLHDDRRRGRGTLGCGTLLLLLFLAFAGGVVGGVGGAALFDMFKDEKTVASSAPSASISLPIQPIPPEIAQVSPAVAVAERLSPSVVWIENVQRRQDFFGRPVLQRGGGSGVVFDAGGYIVTNYHVVEGADELNVALADGRSFRAQVIGFDPSTDLAVVKIEAEGLPTASFADSSQVRIGELAVAIGNPIGQQLERTVTVGAVSGVRPILYGVGDRDAGRVAELIQTDAAINPGNSGGALANAAGQVIGINTFKIAERLDIRVEGIGFAIPANTVRRIVEDLVEHGSVQRAYLGISALNDVHARELLGAQQGVWVSEVFAGRPAAEAGIRARDVIIAIDGEPVENYTKLIQILERRRPGDVVEVELLRGDERTKVMVKLDRSIPAETQEMRPSEFR